jgi:hypothetical protein
VATFLGAANLFLARRTRDGIQLGGTTMGDSEHAAGESEQEVVAVVRPEEAEVAPARDALGSRFLAHGVVEEVVFTGALERLRVRLDDRVQAPLLSNGDGDAGPALQVTRTRQGLRGFQVQPGQSVAVGVRRMHVLPTPLSSFTACAATVAEAEALSHQALLAELAERMKTRIGLRVEPRLGDSEAPRVAADFAGTTVIATRPDGARRAAWLLRRGAKDLWVLPGQAGAPQRVLIHWIGEAARSATLAMSASVVRQIPAEAVYVGIVPADAGGDQSPPQGMRQLLDARSEAQAVHGLEIRTELRFGEVTQELTQRLAESPGQMLVLGVSDLEGFAERFHTLLDGGEWPVLIVHRSAA